MSAQPGTHRQRASQVALWRSGVRQAAAPLAVAAVAVAGTLLVALVDPNRPGRYPLCPLLAITGWACPFCGGLRGVHALTQLDVAAAWAMNPLLMVGAPLLVVGWARWLLRTLRERPPGGTRGGARPAGRGSAAAAWTVLVVLVAFGVARNLPVLQPWLTPWLATTG